MMYLIVLLSSHPQELPAGRILQGPLDGFTDGPEWAVTQVVRALQLKTEVKIPSLCLNQWQTDVEIKNVGF